MTDNNHMKLEFSSKSSNESFARVVVAAFASQLDPTLEEISDIKTSVSEAVTNCIIHGYEYGEGIIIIEARINNDEIEIIISDKGMGIMDIDQAREAFYTSKPDMERSGMGFTVMETFMDSLKIESNKGKGTSIKMTKRFKSFQEKE